MNHEIQPMPSRSQPFLRIVGWLFVVAVLIVLSILLWGNNLLVSIDPMPTHVDSAVVLQGSILGEKARLTGAISLLQQGVANRVLVSVPKESYWGQSIPPVARAYLERTYGEQLASRVDFCETSAGVNSTAQEAEVLMGCIQEHTWRSIVIVTSDYHTHRARILWRKTIARHDPALHFSMEGVADPEFQKPWWRHRQAAKIWLGECTRFLWTLLGGP